MPSLDDLLTAAVGGVGGTPRAGQQQMAYAVEQAVREGRHLLVQAGTGTGKSLAYLVPAIQHAVETGETAVVATATLALQSQIVDRDLPRLANALAPVLGRRPTFALVKGRANYVCAHKLEGGFPDDPDEGALLGVDAVDAQASWLGREVLRVREWAQDTETGEREDLTPGVSDRAWRQVSVSAHECLGSRCPMVDECFVEKARREAKEVDVVVTNHAFMAIDAFEGRQMLPEHDLLVIDEGHELVSRVTSTVTDELSAGMVRAAARKAGRLADASDTVEEAADLLESVLEGAPEGRLTGMPDTLAVALARVRDTTRQVITELKPERGERNEPDGARQVALAAVEEMHENAARILEGRELDVVWLTQDSRRGGVLRVAPMSVAMLVRERVFDERTVVLTSATLELGGTFDAVAGTIGLRGEGAAEWTGLDVGSPFDYAEQGIAYVARHLPPPGRDGASPQSFDEMEALIRAAGGRTLGLFSSMRAAQAATEEMRRRFSGEGDPSFLCQGEDLTGALVRQFTAEPSTCLFGTLSLWQGVDVPGSTCLLVLIDRIPFPRPDDPLASARTQAIAERGGNGFMAVSATHAALLLAQGAGRLIRRSDDRGVVAFLDSRMMTARYAGFLQRSLPPFWPTTDRNLVIGALRRLAGSASAAEAAAEIAASGSAVSEAETAEAAGAAEGPAGASSTTGGAGGESRASGLVGGRTAPDRRPVAPDPPAAEGARSAVTQGHPWTAEQDQELREGLDDGVDLDTLAEHFEIPVELVTQRAQALGLPTDV